MQHEVVVDGRTVVVDRPYSGKARLLVGDVELPKDRFGRYLLPDRDGNWQSVETGFDFRHLTPRLQINGARVLTAPPLPKAAWLLLAPVVALGFGGGALGAVLGITAAMLAAQQLRKPSKGWSKVVAAVGIVLAAVLLYLSVAVLIRMQ
jgi:hypothetical protein